MKAVTYTPTLIAYIDVLGFQEIVDTKEPGFISRLIRIVKEATQPAQPFKKHDEIYQNFSDLSIIATPIRSSSGRLQAPGLLVNQILGLVHAQMQLISEGILVRGSLTVGELVKSWNVIYGPGLVSAYKLEQTLAVHPRIVISDEIFQALRTNPGLWVHDFAAELESVEKLTTRDAYGVTFIDYLRASEEEFDEPEYEYPKFLLHHKKLVESSLIRYSAIPSVRAKYKWLSRYHNATVRHRFKGPSARQFIVAPISPIA